MFTIKFSFTLKRKGLKCFLSTRQLSPECLSLQYFSYFQNYKAVKLHNLNVSQSSAYVPKSNGRKIAIAVSF